MSGDDGGGGADTISRPVAGKVTWRTGVIVFVPVPDSLSNNNLGTGLVTLLAKLQTVSLTTLKCVDKRDCRVCGCLPVAFLVACLTVHAAMLWLLAMQGRWKWHWL